MFSVIIPLYNKSNTIERAICSVLAQTEQSFELIVVDDGSTDDGPDIVKTFTDSRIRLIRQQNGGVSAARNTGIKAAHYEHIVFLDADDEYLPAYLATLKSLIERFPECGIWAVRYSYEREGTLMPAPIHGLSESFEGEIKDYFELASKSAPPICTGAACCTRTSLLAIGGFPIGVRSGEDLLTWARLCATNRLAYCMTPCVIYHLGACAGFMPTRVPQEPDVVGKELKKLLVENHAKGLRRYNSLWHKMRSSIYMRLGMRSKSIKEAILALMFCPLNYKLIIYIILNFVPFRLRCAVAKMHRH